MRNLKILLSIILLLAFGLSNGQTKKKGYFQKNRQAFQKARYAQTNKKYGRACEVLEKKRTKGARRPLIRLGFRRKSNKKMAEQG